MEKINYQKFIIVMLFIFIVLRCIPKISYATTVSLENYKPQMPTTSFVDIDEVICLIRKHTYRLYIICLNIILGWTLIGWIASLIWSFIDNKE